jgi:hypothetical protein
MHFRAATLDDCAPLAELNHQLIRDEGHQNQMSVSELEQRMRGWMAAGEYRAVIFEQAYAWSLMPYTANSWRKFICANSLSRALNVAKESDGKPWKFFAQKIWPPGKRLTVDVLIQNIAAIAFWRAVGYQDYSLTLEI